MSHMNSGHRYKKDGFKKSFDSGHGTGSLDDENKEKKDASKCWKCGEKGHFTRECTKIVVRT